MVNLEICAKLSSAVSAEPRFALSLPPLIHADNNLYYVYYRYYHACIDPPPSVSVWLPAQEKPVAVVQLIGSHGPRRFGAGTPITR